MTINEAMRTYRLPNPTTPEDLECRWSKVLNFGDKVILAGHYYNGIGTNITSTNNPAPYTFRTFTAPSDGYFTITKDNAGRAGLKTFVFDLRGLADGNE